MTTFAAHLPRYRIETRHAFTDANNADGEVDLRITFVRTEKGAPSIFSFVDGGDPGWPAEYEIEKVEFEVNHVWHDAAGTAHQDFAETWFYDNLVSVDDVAVRDERDRAA